MALSQGAIAALSEWCGSVPMLGEERAQARALFFGEGDPRPVSYWPGGGDRIARERRFLGWFALRHVLPGGERASVLAARALLRGSDCERAVAFLEQARYVTVIVRRVLVGSSLVLELEEERFEVRTKALSRLVSQDEALVCHLVPAGWGRWLLGPGWLVLPFRYGPGTREHLGQYQWDPIDLERFLQGRKEKPEQERPEPERDATLAEAVARMTEAARAAGKPDLMLSIPEWTALVRPLLLSRDASEFNRELFRRLGEFPPLDEANRWLHLGMNIWNNTPQLDRGGKSANELVQEATGPITLELRSGEL